MFPEAVCRIYHTLFLIQFSLVSTFPIDNSLLSVPGITIPGEAFFFAGCIRIPKSTLPAGKYSASVKLMQKRTLNFLAT